MIKLCTILQIINKEKLDKITRSTPLFIKGYPISVSTILDTAYYYNFSGSVINVRRKTFLTSVKLRSRRFGAEQRFFIFAPQLRAYIVSYYLSNRDKKRQKSGKVGFEPTDGRPSLV